MGEIKRWFGAHRELLLASALAFIGGSLIGLGIAGFEADTFGNVAEWVGGLGTVAAFAVTLALLFRELENRRADTDEHIRRQARQVSCWVIYKNPPMMAVGPGTTVVGEGSSIVIVRNASDEPIYSVAIVQDPGWSGPAPDSYWDAIGPGAQEDDAWQPNIDVEHEPLPVLSFNDAAGIGWQRDRYGVLSRETSRVGPSNG